MRLFLLFYLLFITLPCFGVQCTINLPNCEILDSNTVLLKVVSSTSPKTRTGSINPSINYGLPYKSEASISVPIGYTYSGTFSEKMGIEGKKVFQVNNTRLTTGLGVFPYLSGGTTEGFFYCHLSQVIPKTRTTFSVGGYVTGEQVFINSGGALFILEQGLTKNTKLVSEFTTGNNNRSNFSIGLKYKPNTFSVTGAVIIPYQHSNVGFQIILSKYLGKLK